MTKRFALIGLIVFYLCTIGFLPYVKAQQYPVQVSTQVNPPFSVFLADYVESGTDRITVSILPTDVNLNNYKVKLKLVIESLDGSIRVETSPYYNPPPVFLQGSVLEMFTSYELYDLFNFNNLIFKGYSRSEYQQTRRLPEGIYRMGIVVLDYNYAVYEQKEVIVSNFGSSTVNMFLNDPPMLNLPLTNDKIKLFDPQNIVFQWTPRHRGSPNSAFSAEYIFRLYEVWGQHTDANIVVNTQVPIFETTLSNTRLVYGIAEPLLIPGKYYVWNVQALEQENRSLFRNNGFSEAFSFKYGDECLAPTQLEGFEIRGPGIQVKWKGGSGVTDYNLQYRIKNNTTWYDENTLLSNLSIYDLAIGTIYETRVKANCGTYESPYSKSIEIKTKSSVDPVFACGNTQVPLPTNTVPQSSLAVGATFMAGGFTCLITEVSGSNGTFSGKCDVTIPFFNYAKVPHTFSQVKINQLNELISGVLLAEMDTANPIMERLDDVYTDDAENGTADIPLDALLDADTAIVVEGTISEISVDPNTGDIIIVTADGETLVVELDEDDTTAVVTDEDGNEYYVADGVVVTGEAALADATGVSTSEVANLDEMRLVLPDIEFTPAELQKYGFDKPIHQELNNSYELIEVRGEARRISWKALQTGVSEPVDAIIPVSDKYDAQAIGFKTASSRFMSKPTGSQNNKTVNAISVLPGVSETLTAFYSMKDTSGNTVEEELGMLNLIAYDKIIRNVYLVPVNTDVSNTEFEMIKQTLNTSYAQAVSEWSLTLHPRFDVAQSEWDVSPEDGIFQAEDENNRMDYTREQKEIYRAFKSQMDPDNDAWYVFIIPHTTTNTGINGYAIFGKQWVYIYKANNGNDMAHTITHELGHAAFSLRHTFSRENEYVVTQNSTQNLMDYAGGTELNKYQWDYIHNPEFTFAFLQDESEGEMSLPCVGIFDDCDDVLKKIEAIKKAYSEGKSISGKIPESLNEKVLVGNQMKLGDVEFDKIMVCLYGEANKEYTINPKEHTEYLYNVTPYETAAEEKILNRGFEFKFEDKHVLRIFVQANFLEAVEKFDALKEYLFDESIIVQEKKIEISQIISNDDFEALPDRGCYDDCKAIVKKFDKDTPDQWNLWALATTNGTNNIYMHKECYELAIKALDNLLELGKPVIVGVDWKDNGLNFDEGITDHWVVIVGRGNDNVGLYYTYFEVAQDKDLGVSLDRNRFYFNKNGYLEAKEPTVNRTGLKPIVTAIRYEPNNCACDRINYIKKVPNEDCGTKYNHIAKPKGTLIKIR